MYQEKRFGEAVAAYTRGLDVLYGKAAAECEATDQLAAKVHVDRTQQRGTLLPNCFASLRCLSLSAETLTWDSVSQHPEFVLVPHLLFLLAKQVA